MICETDLDDTCVRGCGVLTRMDRLFVNAGTVLP